MVLRRQPVNPLSLIVGSGVLGGVVGFGIWMVTDTFVFLPVFLAASLVAGIAIAESRRRP